MKKSRSLTISGAAAAGSIIILAATATLAQPSTSSLDRISLEPGSIEGALAYPGGVQHELIAPYVQSVGPYMQGIQGVLGGIEDHAIFAGSFGLEDFPNLQLNHGNGDAGWEAIRELTQMPDGDWAHPTEATVFHVWQ